MDETRPLFIIRKYRSVMRAAVVIELVAYLVSLTDALIAGRFIGSSALTAIGLMAPLQFTIVFLSAAINSGTLLGYTRAVGAFDRQRACEVFSEGTFTAAGTGLLFAGLMVALRKPFFALLSAEPEILRYLRDYYSVIVLYYLFRPLNVVLDSIVMNDGGEKLSSAANVLQTVGNVLLSYLFMRLWGVRGIAFASALSQLIATAIISTWFFRGKSFLRLVRYFKAGEVFSLCRSGLSRASYFAMSALMIAALNALVLRMFDGDTMAVLILVEKLLDAAEIFMGLSLALQPLIAVLRFEDNTKAERALLHEGPPDRGSRTFAVRAVPCRRAAAGARVRPDASLAAGRGDRRDPDRLLHDGRQGSFDLFLYLLLPDRGEEADVLSLHPRRICDPGRSDGRLCRPVRPSGGRLDRSCRITRPIIGGGHGICTASVREGRVSVFACAEGCPDPYL